MKNYFYLLSVACLILASCDLERVEPGGGNATKFSTTIGGSGSDVAYDILPNADGTYIIVGSTTSFTTAQNADAYIARVSADGVLMKQNHFGDTKNDYATSVVAVGDGSFVFTGITTDVASGSPNILAVKVDAQLNEVWNHSFGKNDSTEYAVGIIPFGTGNFLIGYEATDMVDFFPSVRFLQINSNGNKVSDKLGRTIQQGDYFSLSQMIKTADGSIVFSGNCTFFGTTAAYVSKYSPTLSFIWERAYPDFAAGYYLGKGVVEMNDQSLVVAGSALDDGITSDHDFMMLKYSGIGMAQVDTIWGGANTDELLAVTRSTDDQVVVVGYTSSLSASTEIYLSKRNKATGVEIWTKHFNEASDGPSDIELCPDGGFIMCINPNGVNPDIILVKTDANGETQ